MFYRLNSVKQNLLLTLKLFYRQTIPKDSGLPITIQFSNFTISISLPLPLTLVQLHGEDSRPVLLFLQPAGKGSLTLQRVPTHGAGWPVKAIYINYTSSNVIVLKLMRGMGM